MSIHFLNFAEIIIHRLALSLAAGGAGPGFSWDNFPSMALSHVKTQWVVAQGRSEEDLTLHVFEVTAIARSVARDHAKIQAAQPAVLEDMPIEIRNGCPYLSDERTVVAAAGLIQKGLLAVEQDYDGLRCQLTDAGEIAAGELIERRRQQRVARLTALVVGAAPLLAAADPSAVGTKGLLLDGVAGEDKCEAARLYVLSDGRLAEARFVRLRERDRFDDERTGTFAPPLRTIDALEAVDKYNIEACERRITAARQTAGDP